MTFLRIQIPLLLMLMLAALRPCIASASVLSDVQTEQQPVEEETAAVEIQAERVKKDISHQKSINALQSESHVTTTPLSSVENIATSTLTNFNYQPYVEYGNISPQSQSITRIAFGEEAIKLFKKNSATGFLKQPISDINQDILYYHQEGDPRPNYDPIQYTPEPKPQFVYLPYHQPQDNLYVTIPPPPPPPKQSTQFFYLNQPVQHPQPFEVINHQDYNHVDNKGVVYITPQPFEQYLTTGQPAIEHPPETPYFFRIHNQIIHNKYPDALKENTESTTKSLIDDSKNKTETKDNLEEKNSKDKELLVETSTAKAIIEEYEKHYVKKHIEVSSTGDSGQITKMHRVHSLLEDPIIVPDDNELTDKADIIKSRKGKRPLGTTFLAPITAGIRLQNVKSEKPSKLNFEVEIQKSVPYYLGKYEFVQRDQQRFGRQEEFRNNIALGTTLLKYYNNGHNKGPAVADQKTESAKKFEYTAAPNHQFHFYLAQPKGNFYSQNAPRHSQDFFQIPPKTTKLYPQHSVPLKMYQEISKVPMKSYSYAPDHQNVYSKRKPKSSPIQFRATNSYIGMKPPLVSSSSYNYHFKPSQQIFTPKVQEEEAKPAIQQPKNNYRTPRHSFGEIRLEYGFMPPLIPSIEIDEFGKPIHKNEE